MRAEFDRLRKLGVKFNKRTLRHFATVLINISTSDAYHNNMKDAKSGKLIDAIVTRRWIQNFTNRHGIMIPVASKGFSFNTHVNFIGSIFIVRSTYFQEPLFTRARYSRSMTRHHSLFPIASWRDLGTFWSIRILRVKFQPCERL